MREQILWAIRNEQAVKGHASMESLWRLVMDPGGLASSPLVNAQGRIVGKWDLLALLEDDILDGRIVVQMSGAEPGCAKVEATWHDLKRHAGDIDRGLIEAYFQLCEITEDDVTPVEESSWDWARDP